ncbi:MAG: DUF268 domain-containing protein [Betaproteobacteria bacterium]|nr:DUF268 domain-containing protein [Betaproteobacteria bacterium]
MQRGGFPRSFRIFVDSPVISSCWVTHGRPNRTLRACADASAEGGTASGHYFHQDLHVAQRVFALKPDRHIDVGSRVDGFVAHIASFREVDVLDIRPIKPNGVSAIRFRQADLMQLPEDLRASTDSVSCLHALEHFGLGRYGDPIDPEGYVKGFRSLVAMLKPDGRLHLSVPVGRQRIEFNAHRIFDPRTLLELGRDGFDLCHVFIR